MFSIYLTCLHNMMVQNNLLRLIMDELVHTVTIWVSLRRNMQFAEVKMHELEERQQRIEGYIQGKTYTPKFDRSR